MRVRFRYDDGESDSEMTVMTLRLNRYDIYKLTAESLLLLICDGDEKNCERFLIAEGRWIEL